MRIGERTVPGNQQMNTIRFFLVCAVALLSGCEFNLKNDFTPPPRAGYIWGRDADTPPLLNGEIDSRRFFPRKALESGIRKYEVSVLCFIDEDGNCADCEITSGDSGLYGFDQAAASALRSTRFRPGLLNNRPVKAAQVFVVRFNSGE